VIAGEALADSHIEQRDHQRVRLVRKAPLRFFACCAGRRDAGRHVTRKSRCPRSHEQCPQAQRAAGFRDRCFQQCTRLDQPIAPEQQLGQRNGRIGTIERRKVGPRALRLRQRDARVEFTRGAMAPRLA
jgi:hypothetical protein